MTGDHAASTCDSARPPDNAVARMWGDGDPRALSTAIRSALDTVRREYAAELRYRRVVAWAACALVGFLLLVLAVGAYIHRDKVADLERNVAAAQAVADERARTIQELRAQLAAGRGAPDGDRGRVDQE